MIAIEEYFELGREKGPEFREISNNEYRQLECGIYNQFGRKLNITPRVLDKKGNWTGEYKDWSHLQVITIRQGYFEYLNMLWLFIDQRPNKVFKHYCKEAYVFDKKCIVIQQLEHDSVSAKILTDDEELKLYIEDVLSFKPMSIVPKREIHEINELEHHGLKFGSNQINVNVHEIEEEVDENGLVITNIDHFDNYVYEVYNSLRNIYRDKKGVKNYKKAEEQCIWLEDWIDSKQINNSLESLLPYMTEENIKVFNKYTYRDEGFYDRRSCGGYLFEDTTYKEFDIETLEEVERVGKRMDSICKELDIPISVGWDIWKILNKEKMKQVITRLNKEYPL